MNVNHCRNWGLYVKVSCMFGDRKVMEVLKDMSISGVPRNFVRGRGGGGSTNSVEDGENGDLGAVAP